MIRPILVAMLLALPGAARAFTLGLDLDPAWITDSHVHDKTGWGASLRLGNDLNIPEAKLQLEVGGGIRGFSNDRPAGINTTLYQVFGGPRIGVGDVIRPGVYGHVGYGWGTGGGGDGMYLEGGIFADLALPIISVGIHAAYQSFVSGSFPEVRDGGIVNIRPNILVFGVHGALSF